MASARCQAAGNILSRPENLCQCIAALANSEVEGFQLTLMSQDADLRLHGVLQHVSDHPAVSWCVTGSTA